MHRHGGLAGRSSIVGNKPNNVQINNHQQILENSISGNCEPAFLCIRNVFLANIEKEKSAE